MTKTGNGAPVAQQFAVNFTGGLTRRGLLIAGGLGAASLALAACTPGGTTDGGAASGKLNVWLWSNGPAVQKGLTDVAKLSKDLSGVSIAEPTVYGSDFTVAQQLNLALSARSELPDIAALNYTQVPSFASVGALADISKAVAAVNDDLYEGAKSIISYDGKAVAFPQAIKSKMFFYRADLFEQAGIDPTTITTTDQFLEAGRKFTATFPGKHIININTAPPQYVFGMPISAAAPISFADENGKYQIESNPVFGQTLGFLRELRTSGVAFPIDDFSTDWPKAIENGTVCGFLTANWMAQFLPDYAGAGQAGKWKSMQWPLLSPLPDQRLGSDAGGSVLVVPKGAPNEEIALELLNQARFTADGSMAFMSATGNVPVMKSLRDTVVGNAASGESGTGRLKSQVDFFGADYLDVLHDSFDSARTFGYSPRAVDAWNTVLPPWLNQTMTGEGSIEEILAGLQADMESQIGNPYA